MRLRGAQAALFGLVLICFLLPFATGSCGSPPPIGETLDTSVDNDEEFEFKGYELLVGKPAPEDIAEAFALEDVDYGFPSEPFAVLMLLAAVAGIGVTLFGKGFAELGGAIAGLVGLVAAILLGVAPQLGAFIFFEVSWQIGYWISLILFAAATAVGIISVRRDKVRRSVPGPLS